MWWLLPSLVSVSRSPPTYSAAFMCTLPSYSAAGFYESLSEYSYVSWRYLHVDGAPFYLTPSEINYSVCPGHTLVPRAQCAPCN